MVKILTFYLIMTRTFTLSLKKKSINFGSQTARSLLNHI